MEVSDKVIVITGASKGIGRELAKSFAKENAKVVLNYFHSEQQAKNIFEDISRYNAECFLIKADVTNPLEVSKMFDEVVNKYGNVDVLINNAGICDDSLIQVMSYKKWENVINVNLTGTFLCCREFSKIMIKQRTGKIINIASLKGQEGCSGQVNYSSSKAGIIALTKSLAKELGQYSISVNAICPGFIVTDLNRNDANKIRIAQSRSLLSIEDSLSDLVNYLIYMASDKFVGISGRVFYLDSRVM